MEKYYSLGGDDKLRINHAAEKIYSKKENLIGKLITWEAFTTEWLWFDLPVTELDRINWVAKRSTWTKAINSEFEKRNNACRLYNVPSLGVNLFEQTAMVSKHVVSNTKKATNCLSTIRDRTESMIESDTDGKRLLRIFDSSIKRTLTYLYGEVQLSGLPKGMKKDVLKIITNNLPQDKLFDLE